MFENVPEVVGTVMGVAFGAGVMAVLYILPLFLAWRAWRNGYRGWAWATGISTLFSVGLPVGLVALVVTRKPAGPQTVCPECGEPSRAVGAITLNRETGEQVRSPILAVLALIGGIAVSFFGGWMLVSFALDPLPANVNVGSPCVTVGFMISIGGSMAAWGVKSLGQRNVEKVEVVKYKCRACKHQWRLQADGTELDGELVQNWSE
jgi:hypothetical protein